jgi:hypothetical protein
MPRKKKKLVQNEEQPLSRLQHIVTNLITPAYRWDTFDGREHMVVPMVMLVEGVHNGNVGPLLYRNEDLAKTPEAWNHKPIVVYHPVINGVGVSACDPDILKNRKVGTIFNAKMEKTKLHAEAWLDPERLKMVDERILPALEKGQMLEVSTGLFTDNEMGDGVWNGEEYKATAKNYRPDHLAILPDIKGACSIADGAGLLRVNEASHGMIREQVQAQLRRKYGEESDVWIEDVFTKFVVFSHAGTLFKQEYTVSNEETSLEGLPVEVVRITQYQTTDGNLVGNVKKEFCSVKKKEMVDSLISNSEGVWSESDRDWLMKQDEERLKKLNPVLTKNGPPTTGEPKPKKKDPVPDPVSNAPKIPTLEEYVSNAPIAYRDVILSGLHAAAEEKKKLVELITNAEGNKFTPERLISMGLETLRQIASLIPTPNPTAEEIRANALNFAGLGDVFSSGSAGEVPVLDLPTMNFDPSK